VALSDSQKADIRRWLGYPDPSMSSTTTRWSVEANMDEVSAAGETVIGEILTRLDAIWNQVTSLRSRAGLKKVEDIEFFGGGDGIEVLGMEGNELADQLAVTLDVAVRQYPFRARRLCGGIARRGA